MPDPSYNSTSHIPAVTPVNGGAGASFCFRYLFDAKFIYI